MGSFSNFQCCYPVIIMILIGMAMVLRSHEIRFIAFARLSIV